MFYNLIFEDVASDAVANQFMTAAAIIASANAGYRARLRSFTIGFSDDAPVDLALCVKINRIDDVSGGGAGTKTAVTVGNMGRPHNEQRDGVISGGVDYTVEPTVYRTEELFVTDLNTRGGFSKSWGIEDAPMIDNDQILGLLVAPRSAVAIRVSGTLVFEEY